MHKNRTIVTTLIMLTFWLVGVTGLAHSDTPNPAQINQAQRNFNGSWIAADEPYYYVYFNTPSGTNQTTTMEVRRLYNASGAVVSASCGTANPTYGDCVASPSVDINKQSGSVTTSSNGSTQTANGFLTKSDGTYCNSLGGSLSNDTCPTVTGTVADISRFAGKTYTYVAPGTGVPYLTTGSGTSLKKYYFFTRIASFKIQACSLPTSVPAGGPPPVYDPTASITGCTTSPGGDGTPYTIGTTLQWSNSNSFVALNGEGFSIDPGGSAILRFEENVNHAWFNQYTAVTWFNTASQVARSQLRPTGLTYSIALSSAPAGSQSICTGCDTTAGGSARPGNIRDSKVQIFNYNPSRGAPNYTRFQLSIEVQVGDPVYLYPIDPTLVDKGTAPPPVG